jgi:hypothetical protein
MTVKTTKVTGRRQLQFENCQQVLDDVRTLASGPHRQLGNWSLGEICHHLAKGFDMATEPSTARFPWLIRTLGPYIKKLVISRPFAPGFKAPQGGGLVADPAQAAVGVSALEKSIERFSAATQYRNHPVFGPMTPDEWRRFQMRHCDLHLSFLVPE